MATCSCLAPGLLRGVLLAGFFLRGAQCRARATELEHGVDGGPARPDLTGEVREHLARQQLEGRELVGRLGDLAVADHDGAETARLLDDGLNALPRHFGGADAEDA